MVRPPGFEPGTIRLRGGCSTTELWALIFAPIYIGDDGQTFDFVILSWRAH